MQIENRRRGKRSLLGLLISQFFGAFNDNAWKVMLFTLATRPLIPGASFETSSQLIATLSLVIFLVPMMLFSLPAGALADQFSKRSVIIQTKFLEVILMGASALSLFFAPTHLILPFILLGLMGAQSALFGPAKYGIMPELLPKEDLSKGNGVLEMWTMIAIIAGTGLGPVMLAADSGGHRTSLTWLGPLWLSVLSFIGLVGAFFIRKVPTAREKKQKISASLKEAWSSIKRDRVLRLAILGSIVYWTMMSLLGQNVLVYAKALVMDLEKGELLQGLLPASFGIGIALGALLSGRFSRNIEYGFIPLGAIGFALSSLFLASMQPEMFGTMILLILMGLSCGFLIVPIHAIVQSRAPDEGRGSIIALGNFLDIGGMIMGSLTAGAMAFIGFGLKTMLIISAMMVLLATLWCIQILPKALIRLCFIILTRTFYRLRVVDLNNLPKEGPLLLVSNHISVIDALFVMASVDRPIRFLMNESYYNKWYIQPIAKLMGAIPVSSTTSPQILLKGLRKATDALKEGEIVCIFPEGQVSHTGKMLPFRRGIEIITRGSDFPIVPIHIANVWGSIFSFDKGKFFKKWPQRFSYALTLSFGKSLPSNTPASALYRKIEEMECDSWMARKEEQAAIHHQFIQNMRKCPFKLVLADKARKLKGWQALSRSIALGRKLKDLCPEQKSVGILLPIGIEAILVNLSVTLSGKVAVNLNMERKDVGIALKEANLKTVITSRSFVEESKWAPAEGVQIHYIENLFQFKAIEKIGAFYIGFFTEATKIEKYCGATREIQSDDPLAIHFTSGSTGEPKGVVLSHFNVSSNVEAVSQVTPYLGRKKNLIATLPLSHSFGYIEMWLGLNCKIGLITHPDPMDFKAIAELIKQYKVQLMMTNPSILEGFIKKVLPDQLGSLVYVITGFEKLNPEISDRFEGKFGIRPMERYGAAECSPVIAASTLDVRQAGIYQVGTIRGSVGQTIPGVIVKVVDPETFEELPHDSKGLLFVKGPNIMQGYLNREDLTKQVMHNGWYNTGDLACIDENGFITIEGRYVPSLSKLSAPALR